jgi:hypothetical protein
MPIFANFETAAIIIGGIVFAASAFILYRWILQVASSRST